MTSRACLFSWFFGFATVLAAGAASAGENVEVVSSQFADKIEAGVPTGDGKGANLVTYVVWVKNPGDASHVVLVWSHDGKETARQSLDVGKSAKWRTWGMAPARGAKTIEVKVLDDAGRELKKDVLEKS